MSRSIVSVPLQPILVVGAGIAGLAAALALARVGRSVRVVEQRSGPAMEGAGLQIGPNGTRALRQLGVADGLAPLAAVPLGIDVRRGESGRFLTRLPLGAWMQARHGHPYWVVHRADLADVLEQAARAAGVEIAYGVSTTTLEPAQAVIAADGVWSQLRSRHFGTPPPRFTGRVALRTRIPRERAAALFHDTVTVWMAACAHAVTYPIRAGREINIVVVVPGQDAGAHWSTPIARPEVATRTSVFAYDLRRLITSAEAWRQWPLVEAAELPTYAQGTMALIGDAAHPMLPFLAQGAVMALEDAVALAGAVEANPHDLSRAFATYSDARLARTRRVVTQARANGQLYHLSGIAAAARDTALLVAPAPAVMARYDWLYGGPAQLTG